MARPRTHPEGTTVNERVAASTRDLLARGGARKTFRLQPPAMTALQVLMARPDAPGNETLLIEQLLTQAAAQLAR